MYKCKLIGNGKPKDFENQLNDFLKTLEDGQLIDVKFQFQVETDNGTYGSDAYTALVTYRLI